MSNIDSLFEFMMFPQNHERQLKSLLRVMGVQFSERTENGITSIVIGTHCLEPELTFDKEGEFIGLFDAGKGVWYPIDNVEDKDMEAANEA